MHPTAPTERPAPPRRHRRRRRHGIVRALLVGLGLVVVTAVGLFWGIHRVPGLGPAIADGLRVILGPEPVAKLEDCAYAVDDRVESVLHGGEKPKTYWDAPRASTPPALSGDRDLGLPALAAPPPPSFRPRDVGPMRTSAPGDGVWLPVVLAGDAASESPLLYKTMLHPDPERARAELFVVAIDLSRVALHVVAGAVDPEALEPEGKTYQRRPLVPLDEQADLVVAFNGGFKAEHGRFGMRVDGVTLIAPREGACTIAAFEDGSLHIAPWKELSSREHEMRFLRQTPPCMYTHGKRHRGLAVEETTNWGAAVGGDAVIRRSAIGLGESGGVLFVGISNATTAPAIADGMLHAGAWDVAQLDVNWSFPKVLVFRRGPSGDLEAESLFPGFVFDRNEYVRKRAPKDFFYVVRRHPRS